MDDATQLAQLQTQLQEVLQLKEELSRENAKRELEHQALLQATQTLMDDRDRLTKRVEELEAINKELTNMVWGRRSERREFDPHQIRLFSDGPAEDEPRVISAEEEAEEKIDEALIAAWKKRRRRRRTKRGTQEFPEHMERRERVLDLPDEEKAGLKYIGDAVTERMRFERPRAYVERIVRRKYVVEGKPEEGVKAMPAPLAIVEGCKYGFDVIAAMIALKYAFHQPTYRQQDWFAQCGWFPSRSTINDMLNHGVATVQPLVNQMFHQVLVEPIVQIDETRILLLTRNSLNEEQQAQLNRRGKSSKPPDEDSPLELNQSGSVTSYAWLFAGLDDFAPYNLFHWSLTRQHCVVDEQLADFRGTVVADAYDAYAYIEKRSQGRIAHASCNAHARREFVKAEGYEPILCAQIEALYRQLYRVETRAKDRTPEARHELRQRDSVPIWKKIEQWLHSEPVQRAALPSSRFGKAVGYLKNQWIALQKYLSDGRLPIDNNQAERIIRPLTVGRDNWLFLGHPQAAIGRLQLLSVVSSAHRHNLIVEDYLTDVLTKLADAAQNHPCDLEMGSAYLLDLLPDRWAASHPRSIRHGRVAEKKNVAEAKRVRRAQRRQLERQKRRSANESLSAT